MKNERVWVAAAVGVGVWLLLRSRSASASTVPTTTGVLTVGGKTITIDDNVLNDNFGLPAN